MASYRRSYVFRLGSDPECWLWTGVGKLETPADAVDPSGATWLGAGEIITLPALKALINGAADRVRFTLSGVSAATLRLALEDRESVRGAEARIGWVEFDVDWQLIGGVHWDWSGIADVISIERTATDTGASRSISLSVAASDTLRSNPPLTFWTSADQRRRSSDDAFCDEVASITLGASRRFGPR